MRERGRIWLYLRVLPLVLLACNSESRHLVAQTLEQILFGPSCTVLDCGAQAKASAGANGHPANALQTASGSGTLPGGVAPIFGLWLIIATTLRQLEQARRTDKDNGSRAPPIPLLNAFSSA